MTIPPSIPDAPPVRPRPTRPLLIPLVLVALVAWQWVEAGGPPRRGGSILPGILVAALVLWAALVTVVRPRWIARIGLPILALLLGATVLAEVWLVVQGRVSPVALVPWCALVAFCTWLWWKVRRAQRATQRAAHRASH